MLCIISLGYSQEFLGIKVDGNLYEAVAKFKAKGFRLVESSKSAALLTGTLQFKTISLVIISTPKSHKVWKFVISLPEKTSWYSLKVEYNDYVEVFNSKYGKPTNSYSFYEDPYEEGDGFELQAIRNEKATFASYWLFDNIAYSVRIHKDQNVELNYQNTVNFQIHKKETDEQNYSTF